MVQIAKSESDSEAEHQKELAEEMRTEMFKDVEKDHLRLIQKNEQIQEQIDDRTAGAQENQSLAEQLLRRKESSTQSRRAKLQREEGRVSGIRANLQSRQKNYLEALRNRAGVEEELLKAQAREALELEAKNAGTRAGQEVEQTAQVHAEREARRILSLAINRFARPYCPERGIGNVQFPNPETKTRVMEWKKRVEEVCGVDIVFNEEYQSASVMGFDPVRRELGRLLLEALVKQRSIDENRIQELHKRIKADLFQKFSLTETASPTSCA